jgi:hypothetical protein
MNVLTYGKHIITIKRLVIIILIMTGSPATHAQQNILDKRLSFKLTDVSIASVLKSISHKTGYHFTYDTDLIEPERLTTVRMDEQPLRNILDTIFHDKLLNYSIIDNHIIIYQAVNEYTPLLREEGRTPVYILSGIVTDAENGQSLPYATIGVKEKGKGTISNYEGEYNLVSEIL